MRKGILSSLPALLAGTSLALAQAPATSNPSAPATTNGTGQPPAATPPHDAVPPYVDGLRSPYWPNPFGMAPGAGPAWGPPAPVDDGHGAHRQLVVWGGAEYLLWWVKNQPLSVPLVTAGTPDTLGVLGAPGTALLFGGSDIDYHTFSGGRFTLGLGLGCAGDADWGVEGTGLFLEKRPARFLATSSVTGVPVLARPIINALDGTETVALVSDPGVSAGSIAAASYSDLYGWEVNLVGGNYRDGPLHLEVLGGFRYLNISESLDIGQSSNLLTGGTAGVGGAPLVPPGSLTIFDHFGTRNEFYGAQIGGRGEYSFGRVFVSALGKIAFGSVHEVVNLGGFTSGSGTAPVVGVVPAGLLVLSSNSGARAHDEFAVVPEIGLNVGYQICHGIRAFVGYSFLYCSDVARPGDQVSRVVNPTILPASRTFGTPAGPAQPSFTFQRTDFWAQGVNFGFEVRY